MITDGLNPLAVLLFLGAAVVAVALVGHENSLFYAKTLFSLPKAT